MSNTDACIYLLLLVLFLRCRPLVPFPCHGIPTDTFKIRELNYLILHLVVFCSQVKQKAVDVSAKFQSDRFATKRELTTMSRLAAEAAKIFPPDFASVDPPVVYAQVGDGVTTVVVVGVDVDVNLDVELDVDVAHDMGTY